MTTRSNQPWVEKYRPRNIDEISSQEEVVNVLRSALHSSSLPHLLFYGPPGTGKTSTILAMSRQLFGPQMYKERILELNASDERGIGTVREKIKNFAQIAVGRHRDPNYPCPPFKIIILDEADTMTHDAQSALRRVMEEYSSITRFCLVCNYVTRIIEPLASRCAKFRFKPLPTRNMIGRLRFILEEEAKQAQQGEGSSSSSSSSSSGMVGEAELDTLLDLSDGDMRRAVTFLQTCSQFSGSLTADDLRELAGIPPLALTEDIWATILDPASSFDSLREKVDDCIFEGFSLFGILTQLHTQHLLPSSQISDLAKAKIAIRMAEADQQLTEGASEELQMLAVCSFMMTTIQQNGGVGMVEEKEG